MFLGVQQTEIRIPGSVRETVKYQIVRVQQYYRVDSTPREVRNINMLPTVTPWLTYRGKDGAVSVTQVWTWVVLWEMSSSSGFRRQRVMRDHSFSYMRWEIGFRR